MIGWFTFYFKRSDTNVAGIDLIRYNALALSCRLERHIDYLKNNTYNTLPNLITLRMFAFSRFSRSNKNSNINCETTKKIQNDVMYLSYCNNLSCAAKIKNCQHILSLL